MLSDVDIKIALGEKAIQVSPLDKNYIQPSSIDLRIGWNLEFLKIINIAI